MWQSHILLFFLLFFPFLHFLAPQASSSPSLAEAAVVSMGAGRSLNLRGRGTFLPDWRSFGVKRVRQIPLFSSPSTLLLLGPDVGTVMGNTWQSGVNEAPAWKRGALENRKIAREWGAWETDYLKLFMDSWSDFQVVHAWVWFLNSIQKHWGLNYGIAHP